MDNLQAFGIFLVEIDTCNTAVVHLSPELAEVGAPLMPHPSLREQAATATGLEDADGEIDILAETHPRETAKRHVCLPAYAHIERAWIELVEFLIATPYASRGIE